MARAENKKLASTATQLIAEFARMKRIEKNLTQEDVGHLIGYTASAVSALETGARPPSDLMLVKLEEVLGDEQGLFDRARDFVRMDKYPHQFKDFAPLEQAAVTLSSYVMMTVHGLFQTEEYARALISGGFPPLSEQRVGELVEARMERKALFDREPVALIELVIDEAVLRRVVGDERVMRDQLLHLAECGRRRNVTLQVLPLDAGRSGQHAGTRGPMTLVETNEHDRLVYLEPQDESLLISDRAKVSTYTQRYAKIRAQALGPHESLGLIEKLAGATQ
ncbi:helix-turn-helix transcriptional regulator [Streptomyces sp. NPDC050418]|uniref:helix-turn-helix transcriptional regulator n=1 Tax=Streptomyces sp. NPDC050418 TaxID=3365612 RepID=UPI0037930725